MIDVIFTVDYEIYGNGEGSLRELVYERGEKLKPVFQKWNARCVVFVEAAEFEIIGSERTDPAINLVERQIREFHGEGFEIGLHLHPQWYNAEYGNGSWHLDYGEYNLCRLSPDRIDQIIDRSIAYLRKVLAAPGFCPLSFRAGNWLLQPTRTVSKALAEKGIKIDSSVFKGGVQHRQKMNYRRALKNGYFWPFSDNVNVPDSCGALIEFPIYTRMRPIWSLFSSKRIGLQKKSELNKKDGDARFGRVRDYLRIRYPMKFDFCRMSITELTQIIEEEIRKDQKDPGILRPLIAIGHTKDLVDITTVEALLSLLQEKGIKVTSFRDLYNSKEILGAWESERGIL